ncbi:hypothetical protein C8Q73DRAFT_66077 [Cubamyces lactineus]|nr:hypothetical protein C8Q73DRAFT_66077 [Cubamyces lactineus]
MRLPLVTCLLCVCTFCAKTREPKVSDAAAHHARQPTEHHRERHTTSPTAATSQIALVTTCILRLYVSARSCTRISRAKSN